MALCAAFPKRHRVIPQALKPDQDLLRQFKIYASPTLEIYLQHFENPEPDDYFHCHEWPHMRSFVLSGMFCEERYDPSREKPFRYVSHVAPSTYTMDRDVWHRTHAWGGHCWTLFVCRGGRTERRGYRKRVQITGGTRGTVLGQFIPWRQHIKRVVPSLTGIRTP
jgi:hypothetical protein